MNTTFGTASTRLAAVLVTAMITAAAPAAFAGPVTGTARATANVEAGKLGATQTQSALDSDTASGAATASNSAARAAADLSTAIVRTEATSQAPSGQTADREIASAFAAWYDVLTFDNGGTVDLTFDIGFDGVLRRTAGSIALAKLNFTIYDVTDVGTVFGEDGRLTRDVLLSQVSDLDYYAEARDSFDPSTAEFLALVNDEILLSTDGIDADIEIDWGDTYGATLTSGRQYLFAMEGTGTGSTFEGTSALSDFYNTASFGFSDLDGAAVTSESGLFPGSTASVGDVPAPAGIGLFLLGLGNLAARRRRRG